MEESVQQQDASGPCPWASHSGAGGTISQGFDCQIVPLLL